MEVFALSGPSGTGKSTSALSYAHEYKIPAIIDDGLLIYNGTRIAGSSAKLEQNSFTAVKRATFYFDDHTEEIKEAIRFHGIEKILLIGTSIKMVDSIASRLELGGIDHYVDVRSIRNPGEIKLALFVRKTKGSHVMPIPSTQLETNFFKRIIEKGIQIFSPKREVIGETTIVRPNFHKDSIIISEQVYKEIVLYCCNSFKEVASCQKISINLKGQLVVEIKLKLYLPELDRGMTVVLQELQEKIRQAFRTKLDLEVSSIDLHVMKLV